MKSNKKGFTCMRVSMLLMIMALITTCIVGGTYSKYSHSGTGVDNARIAKFGVTIEAYGTAFSNEYDSETESMGRGVVKSVLSTDKVIAPGTSGEMVSMAVSGRPEVSVEVKYIGEFSVYNWIVMTDEGEEKFYCPITITVGNENITGTSFDNAEDFALAVNNAIADCSGRYDAELFVNDDIGDVITVPSVSWRWDFEGDHIIDKYDTYLADKACENAGIGANDKISTINLIITTTITQID